MSGPGHQGTRAPGQEGRGGDRAVQAGIRVFPAGPVAALRQPAPTGSGAGRTGPPRPPCAEQEQACRLRHRRRASARARCSQAGPGQGRCLGHHGVSRRASKIRVERVSGRLHRPEHRRKDRRRRRHLRIRPGRRRRQGPGGRHAGGHQCGSGQQASAGTYPARTAPKNPPVRHRQGRRRLSRRPPPAAHRAPRPGHARACKPWTCETWACEAWASRQHPAWCRRARNGGAPRSGSRRMHRALVQVRVRRVMAHATVPHMPGDMMERLGNGTADSLRDGIKSGAQHSGVASKWRVEDGSAPRVIARVPI